MTQEYVRVKRLRPDGRVDYGNLCADCGKWIWRGKATLCHSCSAKRSWRERHPDWERR